MPQKIDFLVFLKKPQKYSFTAKKIALYASCFYVLLIALAFIQIKSNALLNISVNDLQHQSELLQQQVLAQTKTPTVSLKERLVEYKKNNHLGFDDLSSFIQKLSEIHLCGLWLTQFDIRNGGDAIELQGEFYQKELIFKYQKNLQQWSLLSDDVVTLNMTGPLKTEQPYQFSMLWNKRETQ